MDNKDPELNKIIAEYLKAETAGQAPDQERLIEAHADLAYELRAFFQGHNQRHNAAHADQRASETNGETLPPAPTAKGEEETLGPGIANERSLTADASIRNFGDYELLEEIARGGMGVVFRAHQKSLNRIVALKMILSGRLAGDEDVQRFYAEAEAAVQLEHIGIVPVYEVGELNGQHYFSMGYVEGGNLADRVKSDALTDNEAARLVKQIAEAVAYAHDRGVVHRDLKPANVLLDAVGNPKVTDFGLAKITAGESGLTATGQILGTPGYMPPEQATGSTDQVGPQSDVYALGAILYYLLTGRPPFQAANPVETLLLVLEREPELPSSVNRSVCRPLELICMKCLEKEPEDRYASADALAEDLSRYLHGEDVEAQGANVWVRMHRWARRQPALAAHLGGCATIELVLQANYLITLESIQAEGHAYHLRVSAQLFAWAMSAIVMQRLTDWLKHEDICMATWAVIDMIFYTFLLSAAQEPLGSLFIGYPLLITLSGLFFRVRLVITMTVASTVSFGLLLLLRPDIGQNMNHYRVIFVASLIIIGWATAVQVRRIRLLGRYYEGSAS